MSAQNVKLFEQFILLNILLKPVKKIISFENKENWMKIKRQQGAMNMFSVHSMMFIQGILINISWKQASMLAKTFNFLQSQEFKVHFFHTGWRCT